MENGQNYSQNCLYNTNKFLSVYSLVKVAAWQSSNIGCFFCCLFFRISLHSRISNNLNQYARKANETGKLYEEDIAEIKKMHNEQTKFLKKTLEAVMYLYEEDSKKKK